MLGPFYPLYNWCCCYSFDDFRESPTYCELQEWIWHQHRPCTFIGNYRYVQTQEMNPKYTRATCLEEVKRNKTQKKQANLPPPTLFKNKPLSTIFLPVVDLISYSFMNPMSSSLFPSKNALKPRIFSVPLSYPFFYFLFVYLLFIYFWEQGAGILGTLWDFIWPILYVALTATGNAGLQILTLIGNIAGANSGITTLIASLALLPVVSS